MADLYGLPGDTVEVDYSVTNSGELEGTQDIVLVADDGTRTNVDQIGGVTLEPAGSNTGTLVWEQAPEGIYTLCVESEDSSDCISVALYGIPDSVVDHMTDYWEASEDEVGNSTVVNKIGDVDISLNGAGWTTDADYVGGAAFTLDGNNDYWETESPISANNDTASVGIWATIISSDRAANHIQVGDNLPGDGWSATLSIDADNDEDVTIRTDEEPQQRQTFEFNQRIFLGVSLSYNSIDTYIYDDSSQLRSNSDSTTRVGTADQLMRGGVREDADRWAECEVEAIMVNQESALSESEWDGIHEDTR